MDEEEYIKKIGSALLELRQEKRLSQQELSYRTGIEKPYIRKLEKGRTNPTVKTLMKLSTAFEKPLSHIFAKVDSMA